MTYWPVTTRLRGRESLDDPMVDPSVLRAELGVLRRFNRVTSTSAALLAEIDRRIRPAPSAALAIGDFGTGDGEVLRDCVRLASHRGWSIEAIGYDHTERCLTACRASDPTGVARYMELDVRRCGLLAQPCEVAHASLLLHHLTDEDVVIALRGMGQCATRLVVWNDLLRERLGLVGATLATFGSPAQVRKDALTSVRRGFNMNEAVAFAEAAGLADIEIRRWRGGRFVLSARPPSPNSSPEASSGHAVWGRPLARAAEVDFSYGRMRVLRGWSMCARSGSVHLLEGPNGSGKSTALRILAGASAPDRGTVWCDRVRGAVGFLPQQGGLVSTLDLDSNIELLQNLTDMPSTVRAERADDAISCFGMGDHRRRPISELSLGLARRAALATVHAYAGDVLLLDEPDAGLDASSREAAARWIAGHCGSGGTAIVATHDRSWIATACMEASVTVHGARPW